MLKNKEDPWVGNKVRIPSVIKIKRLLYCSKFCLFAFAFVSITINAKHMALTFLLVRIVQNPN